MSGRASAIAVNPSDPDDIWLGTAAGGVWHSLDDGRHWKPESDRQEALAIGAIALDGFTSAPATFGSAEDWTPGGFDHGQSIFFADVTGDGRTDAITIVTGLANTTVQVRRSDGSTFLPSENWTPAPSGFDPGQQTFFADVAGDGRADAISVVAGLFGYTVQVRRSDGSTFLPSENWTPAPTAPPPGPPSFFADVTGDGRADAIYIVAGFPNNTVEVGRSDGSTFLPPENWTPGPSGFGPGQPTFFADVTGDGRADAISVVAGPLNNTVEVRRSDGSAFLPAENWAPGPTGLGSGQPTAFTDVTCDGRADAISVVAGLLHDTVEVRSSDGSAFLPAENWNPQPNGFGTGEPMFFADVTGGGRADAISLVGGFLSDRLEVRRSPQCPTVYAGTGENAVRRDTYTGAGLLIGRIGAGNPNTVTWVQRTGAPLFDFRRGSINDVVLDPTTSGPSKRIFVTLSSGVTTSASEATVTAPEPPGGFGIYRSDDRGASWVKLTVPGAEGARPTDLEMDPTSASVLYAGMLGRGIFKTTTSGTSWCPLNGGIPLPPGCPLATGLPDVSSAFDFVEIALAPSNPSVVYAGFGTCPDRLIQSCRPLLFRSNDGGLSWTQLPADVAAQPMEPSVYSRYTHALAVDPTNENTLLLGGIRIWRSDDAGQSFVTSDTNLSPPPGLAGVHSDCHDVVFQAGNPNRVYASGDGGLATSTDGGRTWTPRNDDLQVTGFQGLGSSPLTGAVIGASQDNGGELWNGSRRWTAFSWICDGGFALLDRDDVMSMYASSNCGPALRSTDGGVTWTPITNGIAPTDPLLFYAPFVQDPSPSHPLYFGTNRLYRSTNRGGSWTAVSPVLATGATGGEIRGDTNALTAIAVAPSDPRRIYVGYYGGQLFRTNLAACGTPACWARIGQGVPRAPVTRIAVHPTRPDTAWVTFSGFSAGPKVFKTIDGGRSWAPSDRGLPRGVPANTINVEPGRPDNVYVGLDSAPGGRSLYRSTDGGTRWTPFSAGLPNAPVYEISIDETHGRLYAATHGRGAWVLGKGFISSFEACGVGHLQDLSVLGQNFRPDQACTVQLLQSNGTVCASGSVDATGGTIRTDSTGTLTTDQASVWQGKPVAWACLDGTCLGDTPISACFDDADGDGQVDPLSTIVVSCGGDLAVTQIRGCASLDNPPSSVLSLHLSGLGAPAPPPPTPPGPPTPPAFQLAATVRAEKGTRSLCTVAVAPAPVALAPAQGEVTDTLLERARDAVNASPTCAASKVQAVVDPGLRPGPEEEDRLPPSPRLLLRAPGVRGEQLMTALHADPGQATGTCFEVSGLGVPVLNRLGVTRVGLTTSAAGAAGGSVTLIEDSALGSCALTVATAAGEKGPDIAAALAAAARARGTSPSQALCPPERNPRDLAAREDAVISVAASTIQVCSNDPGVGTDVRSPDLRDLHPVGDPGGDRVVPATDAGAAAVILDGSASADPDSTPGTHDDLASFEWYEMGKAGPVLLGRGERLEARLGVGIHRIELRVQDTHGLSDSHEVVIRVEPAPTQLR